MRKKTFEKLQAEIARQINASAKPFCHECGLVFRYEMFLEKHQKETGHTNGAEYELSKKIRSWGINRIFDNAAKTAKEQMQWVSYVPKNTAGDD